MFNFQHHTTSGISLPTWLSNPEPVLLRNHRRTPKYDPLVKQVELIEANARYAHIQYQNGVESTVSLRDLAPIDNIVDVSTQNDVVDISTQKFFTDFTDHHFTDFSIETNPLDTDTPVNVKKTNEVEDNRSNEVELPRTVNLRRSTRNRKPPTRLDLQLTYIVGVKNLILCLFNDNFVFVFSLDSDNKNLKSIHTLV